MTTAIHPWRRFAELRHVRLLWHDGGEAGVTDFVDATVSLRRGMTQAERRTTVLHECLHVERGPVPVTLAEREELRVEKLTARLLLPDLEVVAAALAWTRDLYEAADELWVDEQALRVRLEHLDPREHAWLAARLDPVRSASGA
jgi:hypothetical protein